MQTKDAGSSNIYGLLCCVCICATLGFIALIYSPRPQPLRRLWLPVTIETNGDEMVMRDARRMEFWTPSAVTKNFLNMESGQVTATEKWEVMSNEDSVLQFGDLLHSNKNVLGYRRAEVWGQGSTHFKPGWWWTMTVYTDYSVADFAKFYDNYWKSARPVFVEVIDSHGSK